MTAAARVAVLGAESTGKTQLVLQLAAHLRASGLQVRTVPEVLREWCDREGRTPWPHEQAAIAHEQAQRAERAAHDGADWLIADTTPLMTAIYSQLLFADTALFPFAIAHQRGYAATLVTGLDLPWVADGLQRDGPHVRAPVDGLLRSALAGAGIGYSVIYGHGGGRLDNALAALATLAPPPGAALAAAALPASGSGKHVSRSAWTWPCDRCGNAECEHRLFTGLASRRK